MRSLIICLLFAFVCCYIMGNTGRIHGGTYHFDRNGYYIFIPAVFIYHDLEKLDFQPQVAQQYGIGGDARFGLHEMPNGNWLNKYTIGTSLFELPGFAIAYAYCILTDSQPIDGYAFPFRVALLYSTVFWSFIGLLILRRFLLRYFTDTVAAICIIAMGFATNYYCYAIFEQGMSHNFSFLLISWLLLSTDSWYSKKKIGYAYAIGLCLGLIFITRPVNIIAGFIPIFWGVYNRESLVSRFNFFLKRYKDIIVIVICFLAISSVQLLYWKEITGHWIYYSYQGEEFNFSNPHIWKGLFSFRKGWFVYTPVAFIGMCGLFFTPKKYALNLAVFFAIVFYVVFSWENWYYGGGFGCRPLIEMLPVLAVPLGYFIKTLLEKRSVLLTGGFSIILTSFIALNMFQSYQFNKGVLHYDRMTFEFYKQTFGVLKPDGKYDKYLMPYEEYRDEMTEWHNN